MKKVLVIGSTVVDVIIHVDQLPKTQEDVHVLHQHMSLGGCAYNTSDMIRHFQVPYILFSPVGAGAYGDFVRAELTRRGIASPIPAPDQENGCCYCFVENGGERTFISYHGAEYLFQKEWFSALDPEDIDCVYVCGLEIEETTGPNIVSWLEEHPQLTVYFAPGPRINLIAPELLQRLFALHPVLHLNEEEACTYAQSCLQKSAQTTNAPDTSCSLEEAAAFLYHLTGNTVIVTLGERGAYYLDSEESGYVESTAAVQIDTIGAGDSHIGAVIAGRKLGMNLHDAILTANKVASKVVETEGALLPDEEFEKLL
ncbi:MAG: PfkB family carbohydrate kinase [Lachnospiraceae bacterium]|nr:PfkB family carbohydrate kinase [Lachnospiraceae bacterium]